MKRCIKCASELNGDSRFCPKCGSQQPENDNPAFCDKCGGRIPVDAKLCPYCGKSVGQINSQFTQAISYAAIPSTIRTISEREKLCAIFWIIVASLQALLALLNIVSYFTYRNTFDLIWGFILAGISALNFRAGFSYIKFSREILVRRISIINSYIKINPFLFSLIYNGIILLIIIIEGGRQNVFWFIIMALAVASSIFRLVGIRNFALKNIDEITAFEATLQNMNAAQSGNSSQLLQGNVSGVDANKNKRICQKCKKEVDEGYSGCPHCGFNFSKDTSPVSYSNIPIAVSLSKKKCTKCKKEVDDGNSKCPHCGNDAFE
jgi:RNA polymerase subunit RPABC4/transcription elongation factor Spt4